MVAYGGRSTWSLDAAMNRRRELLHRLADSLEPPDSLLAELRTFPFDWDDEPLLVLSRSHLRRILERFLCGHITSHQLEEWADCFETRDDVALDPEHGELLANLLFQLANPTINAALTPALATQMQAALATSN